MCYRHERNIRDEVIEAVDDGFVSKDYLISACLSYMSLEDVKNMLHANDIQLPGAIEEEEEDEDETEY